MTEKIRKLVDDKLEELAASLDAGQSDQLRAWLSMSSRFYRYSVGNQMAILAQMPGATRVAGFHAWHKLGRHVKKGAKSLRILAPLVRRKSVDEAEEEDEVIAFKPAHLWDISQTEGKPMPEFAKAHGDPGRYIERLKQVIAERGITLEYSTDTHGAEGFFSDGKIVIRTGLTPAEEFSVLAHEAAHAMLHGSAESRSANRTVLETEAEAVAFVVGAAIGLDVGRSSADYVSLYDGKKETLLASLERIRRVAAEIIQALEAPHQPTDRDAGVSAEHAVAA